MLSREPLRIFSLVQLRLAADTAAMELKKKLVEAEAIEAEENAALKEIEVEMQAAVDAEDFEKAAELKEKLDAVEHKLTAIEDKEVMAIDVILVYKKMVQGLIYSPPDSQKYLALDVRWRVHSVAAVASRQRL